MNGSPFIGCVIVSELFDELLRNSRSDIGVEIVDGATALIKRVRPSIDAEYLFSGSPGIPSCPWIPSNPNNPLSPGHFSLDNAANNFGLLTSILKSLADSGSNVIVWLDWNK
jgi:hypothetical protein